MDRPPRKPQEAEEGTGIELTPFPLHAIMAAKAALKRDSLVAVGRCAFAGPQREDVMAKGQMRSTKEKKKPKAEWNKKKKGGPAATPYAAGQGQAKLEIMAKKG